MTLRGPGCPQQDLDSRSEIHDFVVRFYREIAFDDLLGPIFEDVAEVDWTSHIPKLISYWCRVLLGEPGYDGWFLGAHRRVHALEAFEAGFFDRWLSRFVGAVDAEWVGPKAEMAKHHAVRLAKVLARQLDVDYEGAVGSDST